LPNAGLVLRKTRLETVTLAGTALSTSRLAFGTASLHRLRDVRARRHLLHAALDIGITHFDTAPYYGFGLAESALGDLATEAVTVTTKVGLYPPGGAPQSAPAVWARKVGGKLWPALSRPEADLAVARARASLHGSLRRLGREQVDLLLLHEPDHRLFDADEWQRWLEDATPLFRAVGVSGEAVRVLPFVQAGEPIAQVVQTRDSLAGDEAAPLRAAGRSPQITFGHLAGRSDLGTPAAVADVLRSSLARHPDTVLLLATRRVENLRAWSAAAVAPLSP